MCVTEVYTDRYPNGGEVEFRQTRLCQYGRPGRPCENHSTLENIPRKIGYGEPTSEFIIRQLNTPPQSSTSSGRPSFEDLGDESPKLKKKRTSGGFLLSTFFGDPPRRRTRRENVVLMEGPPSPRSPRSPRTPRTPPPAFAASFPTHWNPSRLPRTPPPFVYEAAPRGRSPVIVDNRHQPKRASSVEVHVGVRSSERRLRSRSRSRSPASVLAELRMKDEEEERERRRRRDEREARLASELDQERERRRQEVRRALHDAEINARPPVRPAVPNPPTLRRQPAMRAVVNQSDRLNDVLSDMNLSARGERVIAEAVAERRQRDERERMIQAGIEAEEAEAQRQRLRRRFTTGSRGQSRRHRILYDDGTYRYE